MNICIFGDSIVWGGHDPVNGGWVNSLRNYLEEKYDEVTVYNLGICADDSSGLLNRLSQEAAPRNPTILVIAIGANDVKHQPEVHVPFDTFQSNLQKIAYQALTIADKVIFVGITPVDETLTTPRNKPPYNYRENRDIDECNRIIREIAASHNFQFISIPDNFSHSDLCDGLHPNTQGHKKIFETIQCIAHRHIRLLFP